MYNPKKNLGRELQHDSKTRRCPVSKEEGKDHCCILNPPFRACAPRPGSHPKVSSQWRRKSALPARGPLNAHRASRSPCGRSPCQVSFESDRPDWRPSCRLGHLSPSTQVLAPQCCPLPAPHPALHLAGCLDLVLVTSGWVLRLLPQNHLHTSAGFLKSVYVMLSLKSSPWLLQML